MAANRVRRWFQAMRRRACYLTRIRHTIRKRRMPKEGDPVTEAEIDDSHVDQERRRLAGGEDAGGVTAADRTTRSSRHGHWAYKPVADPAVPAVVNRAWPARDYRPVHSGEAGRAEAGARRRCGAHRR